MKLFKKKLVNYFYAGIDEKGWRFHGIVHNTNVEPKVLMDNILKDTGGHLTAFNQV